MSFKRQAFRHSAVYSLANLLGRLAGFVMLPFYARIFETQGYGIIALVDTSIGLLSIAFSTGVHQSILKIYHEEPDDRKSLVIGTAICTVWMFSLLCIPLPALTSPWISAFILDDSSHWVLIVLGLLTFVIDMGGRSASAFLIIRQQSILYSSVNLLQLIIGIALNIFLVIYLRIGIIGVFISSLITASIGSLIFHFEAIRKHGLHYDTHIRKKIVGFWFPLIPGELAAYVGRQAERFIMKFIVGLNGVGILEMAYKFPPLLNIIITFPFMRAWQTKCLEIGSQPEGPREIATMFTYYMFLILFGGVLLAANISTVLRIMTPQEFWPAARIAQVDIATTVVYAAGAYLIFGLLYTKNTKAISSLKTVTAIGRIVFSFAFISFYGIKGAVYSALIMETIFMITSFRLAQKAYRLPLEYSKILTMIIYAILLVIFIDIIPLIPNSFVEGLGNYISNIFGNWKGGKITKLITHNSYYLAQLMVNCCLCTLYLIIILVIRSDKLRQFARIKTNVSDITSISR